MHTGEHLKSIDCKSALSQHQERTGHLVNSKQQLAVKMKIIDKEARESHRKILESMYINLSGASLNRNNGHNLPDLYLPILREAETRRWDQH